MENLASKQPVRRAKNSAAPSRYRARVKSLPVGADSRAPQTASVAREDEERALSLRSSRLTTCLILLVGAVSCISPFLSLHLRHRVGLMLFESIIVQFRSSLLSVIVCLIILVCLNLTFVMLINGRNSLCKDVALQKLNRAIMTLSALISAIAYLSLLLIVPQIRQTQRMPIVTFDCEANLITIENCRQQFAIQAGELGYLEAIEELLNGSQLANERLIEKLNCLKYNSKQLETLQAPTRFLLHNCALICQPQRRHFNQFSDDLNQNQFKHLTPPYDSKVDQMDSSDSSRNQVSLKVCFTGEFSGGSSYKQYCITNLVSQTSSKSQQLSKTLTIGQLNAILRRIRPEDDPDKSTVDSFETEPPDDSFESFEEKVTTHLVNPMVQFESQFKNWPQVNTGQKSDSHTTDSLDTNQFDMDDQVGWCKFKPIPPFIVNNKPFNDIHCSLENEYTLSTSPGISSLLDDSQDRIYLKRTRPVRESPPDELAASVSNDERCKIQCKVNILYQVQKQIQHSSDQLKDLHYYLPLKPCIVVAGSGDKLRTSRYYLIFRTIADSTLIVTFILLDLFLLLESIDSRKYQLETRKYRLILLLLAITVIPIVSALSLTFSTYWYNTSSTSLNTSTEGYLISLVQEKLWPSIKDLLGKLLNDTSGGKKRGSSLSSTARGTNRSSNISDENMLDPPTRTSSSSNPLPDDYLVPFLFYSLFMLFFSIKAISLPIIYTKKPILRVSSAEELGLAKTTNKNETTQNNQQSDRKTEPEVMTNATCRERKVQLIIVAMLTLFMGFLFNLALITQSTLLEETLLIHLQPVSTSVRSLNVNSNLWYVLISRSSTTALLLLVAVLLSDEISSYFSYLSPFKPTSSSSDSTTDLRVRRCEAKLLLHLTISLLVYSARFYSLSAFDVNTRLRWPLIFLFHICEVFNFPLIWFVISARLHELLQELRICDSETKLAQIGTAKQRHLLAQGVFGFIYFVLGRATAFSIHSLHASLYLYSENIDWFISNFYGNISSLGHEHSSGNQLNLGNVTNPSVGGASSRRHSDHQESLFSPLPSEYQTYLYASRLFLKYITILCLLLGLSLLCRLILLRYRLWLSTKPAPPTTVGHSAGNDTESEHIDERLSMDLKRIQGPGGSDLVVHPPTSDRNRAQSPKAKVLFHYETGYPHRSRSSDSTSSEGSYQPSSLGLDSSSSVTRSKQTSPIEIRIPIAIEDDSNRKYELNLPTDETIEKTTRLRSKRVRIFEDCEDWPTTEDEEVQADSSGRGEDNRGFIEKRRRNITFAPTTTLLGETSGGPEFADSKQPPGRHLSVITKRVQCASPEPSIDDETISESSLR